MSCTITTRAIFMLKRRNKTKKSLNEISLHQNVACGNEMKFFLVFSCRIQDAQDLQQIKGPVRFLKDG